MTWAFYLYGADGRTVKKSYRNRIDKHLECDAEEKYWEYHAGEH